MASTDTNKHGQPVFEVEEIIFTYFYMTGPERTRTLNCPPQYFVLDEILCGWEKLCAETGCHIYEWGISETEFVSALVDQKFRLISSLYIKGHA